MKLDITLYTNLTVFLEVREIIKQVLLGAWACVLEVHTENVRGSVNAVFILYAPHLWKGFPGGSDGNESACNARDLGSIPGLGRSPGGGQGNPLQYSCLENPLDRGAWRATVHRVTQSWTRSDLAHTHSSWIAFGSVFVSLQTIGAYWLLQIHLSAKSLTDPDIYKIVPAPKGHPA